MGARLLLECYGDGPMCWQVIGCTVLVVPEFQSLWLAFAKVPQSPPFCSKGSGFQHYFVALGVIPEDTTEACCLNGSHDGTTIPR